MFTSDNQKRLHGPETDVDVYSAWVTGDTRLVYYIDCEEDAKEKVSKICSTANWHSNTCASV
jgi:hypothetical protein